MQLKSFSQHYLFGRAFVSRIALLLLLSTLFGCGGSQSAPTPTPTSSVQYTTFDLRLPAGALNAPVVGPLPANTIIHVSMLFKLNQAALDQLNKQNVKAGQNQDLESLANQIGITDETYQKIKQTLGISSASLTLGKLHTSLSINTSAAIAAAAFQTHFVIHKLQGRTFYAPVSNPKVPAFIAPSILAITGLDNYGPPVSTGHALSRQYLNALHTQQHSAADCSPSFSVPVPLPQDIAHAYGYDQLWQKGWHGEKITVNLIEIDGINQSDIQNYSQCVNFQGNLKVIDMGTPPAPGGESTLDIDMLEGLAPSVNILDYETNGGALANIEAALQKLIDDNAQNSPDGSIVSISLQVAEKHIPPNDLSAIDQKLQVLTQVEHMTVFVASGDCGAFMDGSYNDLSVNGLASDPNVVAVGGTELNVDSNHNRASEVVWSDGSDQSACNNAWGSGGGVSATFQQPSWQTGTGLKNQYSNGFRQLPDVSAVAFNLPFYFQGQWQPVGGTSAATPIWAAGYALVNEGLIQQNGTYFAGPTTFYNVANNSNGATPYYDVTQGSNLYYQAASGWDNATGLGTPNLADFYSVISKLPTQ